MKRVLSLALATTTLGGCSILFDPSDLMDGEGEPDAGAGTDGGGMLDAPTTDIASLPDAPLPDGSVQATCPATPQSATLMTPTPVGAPSITFRETDVLEALVAYPSASGRAVLVDFALGGPGADAFGSAGEVADVADVTDVAVRQVDDVLAWAIVSATPGPGDTQMWVRSSLDGTALNLAGGTVGQTGPLVITGGETPRYFWNAVAPEPRRIASLLVDDTGMGGYRFWEESLATTPDHIAGSNGDLIVAVQGDRRFVVLWSGDGLDNTTPGAGHTLQVDTSFVVAPPAIASLGGSRYVVAAAGEDLGLRLFQLECTSTTTRTTCTEGTVRSPSMPPATIVRMAAIGLGADGLVLVTTDGSEAQGSFFQADLTELGAPQILGDLPMEGLIDVDARRVGDAWHIVYAEVEPTAGTLHVTHACFTP